MKQTKPTGEKQLDKQVSEVQRELHWRFPCSTGMCNVCLAKQTKPTGVKKKKVTTGKLKERAWKEFSRYIRLRDCIATTGATEYGACVSCNKRFPYRDLQAGHYIPGRTGSVLFHEDLVHAQCMRCNVWLHGNLSAYAMYMYSKYTKKQMAEFELLRAQVLPLKKHDYIEIAEKYKYKADRLLENF